MAQAEDTSSSGRPFMVIDGDGLFCFLRSWEVGGQSVSVKFLALSCSVRWLEVWSKFTGKFLT